MEPIVSEMSITLTPMKVSSRNRPAAIRTRTSTYLIMPRSRLRSTLAGCWVLLNMVECHPHSILDLSLIQFKIWKTGPAKGLRAVGAAVYCHPRSDTRPGEAATQGRPVWSILIVALWVNGGKHRMG